MNLNCYYCLRSVEESAVEEKTGDGQLICPYCGVDSVMAFSTSEELKEKHEYNFHRGALLNDDGTLSEITTIDCVICKKLSSVYEYKNKKYFRMCDVMMKAEIWREAVMYADNDGKFYVRERGDFESKFKKVNSGT
jgi:hypothetical protein